jgi:hypothetical protein
LIRPAPHGNLRARPIKPRTLPNPLPQPAAPSRRSAAAGAPRATLTQLPTNGAAKAHANGAPRANGNGNGKVVVHEHSPMVGLPGNTLEKVMDCVRFVRARTPLVPQIAIVLGSGGAGWRRGGGLGA